MIQVIYKSDMRFGSVHTSRLDFLISSGLLFAFRRTHEWAVVDKDPVRGQGGNYLGPDRRKNVFSFDAVISGNGNIADQGSAVNSTSDSVESECLKILELYKKS